MQFGIVLVYHYFLDTCFYIIFEVIKTKNPFVFGSNSKHITSPVVLASVAIDGQKIEIGAPEVQHHVEDDIETEHMHLTWIRPNVTTGEQHSFEIRYGESKYIDFGAL